MQHLHVEISLPPDLPSTEDYFSFLLNYCVLVLPLHAQVTKPDVRWSGVNCCGATEGSDQQHNQDLKEIYKGRRILEFITFYRNALHLTRVHCPTNNSNKNTGKFGG